VKLKEIIAEECTPGRFYWSQKYGVCLCGGTTDSNELLPAFLVREPSHNAVKTNVKYFDNHCNLLELPSDAGWHYIPEIQWRDATIEDAIKAIQGENIVCRCSTNGLHWIQGKIWGYSRGYGSPWVVGPNNYKFCQVKETP
jgi:hypothetical protein